MVKFYFDYHWWGMLFHKTVLNGFISNDKILDLSRQYDNPDFVSLLFESDEFNPEIVVPSTNVESNKIVTPGDNMNGYMESKEFRVKIQDIKVVKNYYSFINPLLYKEEAAFRTIITDIY